MLKLIRGYQRFPRGIFPNFAIQKIAISQPKLAGKSFCTQQDQPSDDINMDQYRPRTD
jgi:hypothetical protein